MNHGKIKLFWRFTVIIGLFVQLFLATLRTPWGLRFVPAGMVRVGLLKPWQSAPLVEYIHPPGMEASSQLANEIEHAVPTSRRLILAANARPTPRIEANLRYLLYPRHIGVASEFPTDACYINWPSRVEAILTCPDFTWHSANQNGAAQ